jgi:outer membrane lipoprotein SlyB
MARSWKKVSAVITIVAVVTACAFQSGTTYSPSETGTAMRVEPARVVSSREVLISGLDNQQAAGWGTIVGATIAGAAAYGLTGADNPAGVAVTIIATVVGGLAGLAAEERRETRRARNTSCATRRARRSRSFSRWARARRCIRRAPTSR